MRLENMMKIILSMMVCIFSVHTAFAAGVVYVSSYKTALYKQAGMGGQVMTLRKGSRLTLLSRQGTWLKVEFMNKTGWVKKFATSSSRPGNKFSILGSAKSNARIHARRRASSDVTAASARGLMEDKESYQGRSRAVDSGSTSFQLEAITGIESQHVPEEDLIRFLAGGGISH